MQQTMTHVRLDQMRGAPVYDNDGDKIGKVEEIFYDHQTRVPEWIGIGTGFLGTKRPPLQPSSPNTMSAGTSAPGACGLGKS